MLRPRRFWTPRYVRDRLGLMWWQRRHPEAPWLAPGAIDFLEQALRPSDVMVEFGSGRSTRWFSQRVGRLVSVEHHRGWYEKVRGQLDGDAVTNVGYLHAPDEPNAYARAPEPALAELRGRATVILVDGVHRDACALWALDHLAPTGLLIIDNAERYLPGPSRGPASIGPRGAPVSELWARFAQRTRALRRVWFLCGVTDTLVYLIEPSETGTGR